MQRPTLVPAAPEQVTIVIPDVQGQPYVFAKSILQDHGGRLMFDSVEGKFTRVDVALPVWPENREAPHGSSHQGR